MDGGAPRGAWRFRFAVDRAEGDSKQIGKSPTRVIRSAGCRVVLVNEDATQISFLGLDFTMPIGVAKLFSAAAGVLVIALIGGVRIHRIRPTFDKRRR